MVKKEPPNRFPTLMLYNFVLIGALIVSLLSIWHGVAFFVLSMVLLLFLECFLSASAQQAELKEKRYQRKRYGRMIAKRKAQESVRAQLSKLDFETRLTNFVSANGADGAKPIEPEEEFVSKTKFWQLENYFQGKTPARPVELLRFLLQRISKLVGQG